MFAIVDIAGFQEKVEKGMKLRVPKLEGKDGDTVKFENVLLIADGSTVSVGTPFVAGASVAVKLVTHGKGEKIRVFKMRRRKRYRKTIGHRQDYSDVEVTGITAGK